jgi:transcriptional regulator with XRE-family HTH domain
MGTRERPADRGKQRGREITLALGREVRAARRGLGLSLREVARAVDLSAAEVSRIERGLVAGVSVTTFATLLAVVGLELSGRAFAGGQPIRDAGHARLLIRFRGKLDDRLIWRTEVPFPQPGDKRAWDATITNAAKTWRHGVEAETRPSDGQALTRRLTLKQRDGGMDGVLLILPDTRHSRAFRAEFGSLLRAEFPVPGADALRRLAAGQDPGGSALIVC